MFPYFRIGTEIVYTYPLIIGFIWASSFFIGQELLRKRNIVFKNYPIFYGLLFIFVWIFSKLLFLVTLESNLIERAINSSNFWLGGGFVFYGGLIGGLIFTLTYSKLTKMSLKDFGFALPILAFGHAFGRIGCFLAGCCFGSETDIFLSVNIHGHQRHIVQVYEAIGLFLIGIYLLKRFLNKNSVIKTYFILYALLRFLLEFLRGDEIRGIYFLSTSQWISLVIIIIGLSTRTCSSTNN